MTNGATEIARFQLWSGRSGLLSAMRRPSWHPSTSPSALTFIIPGLNRQSALSRLDVQEVRHACFRKGIGARRRRAGPPAFLVVLLITTQYMILANSPAVSAADPACVADQPPNPYIEWSSDDPFVLLQPLDAAAQTFRPERSVLCTLFLELYADASDVGGRVVLSVTVRETLDGPPLASHRIDTILTSQNIDSWNPFLQLTPAREYYAHVEMTEGSRPLRWYWARASYDRGEAWVRTGGAWQTEPTRDLLFATFGFDDPSSYPLPDPAWTPEEWQGHNWKTYPIVATWTDVSGDGAADVYTFNNSFLDGRPVSVNGSVNPEALDRTAMAPVNLSMSFEFTSHVNAWDNRSTLRILVDRIPDPSQNDSASWPAWILLDSIEFLPLLFAPPGVSLDTLNLTWEATLEENAFHVYVKTTPENPQGEVWIYVGHFSTQSIIVRGPAVPHVGAPPPTFVPFVLVGAFIVAVAAVLTIGIRRRRRTKSS